MASTSKYNNVVEVEKYLLEYAEIRDISIYGSYNPGMSGCMTSDFMDGLHLKPEKLLATFVKRNVKN